MVPSTHYLFALRPFKFAYMEMKIFENTLPPYEIYLQILGMLFTSHITTHTTLGNEQCLKLLLGVCNTEDKCDLYTSDLIFSNISSEEYTNI